MISAKVDCVDVNDFFTSSNSKDFSFFPNPFSLGMLVTCWGVGVHFFCIWVGYLRFSLQRNFSALFHLVV
jgi:hypothetical protein